MSKAKFALGAFIGAAAGLVAGFLTAPKSGKETRADLKVKADELKGDAQKKVNDLKKQGDKVVTEAKKTVDDVRDRAERAVNAAKHEVTTESKK